MLVFISDKLVFAAFTQLDLLLFAEELLVNDEVTADGIDVLVLNHPI